MPPHVDLLESAQHRPGGARHCECLHGAAAAAAASARSSPTSTLDASAPAALLSTFHTAVTPCSFLPVACAVAAALCAVATI